MRQTELHIKNRLVLVFALVAILCMQFFYQIHQYDENSHHVDEVCKICLKLSSLDDGLIVVSLLNFNSTHVSSNYFFSDTSIYKRLEYRNFYSRAPPQLIS